MLHFTRNFVLSYDESTGSIMRLSESHVPKRRRSIRRIAASYAHRATLKAWRFIWIASTVAVAGYGFGILLGK